MCSPVLVADPAWLGNQCCVKCTSMSSGMTVCNVLLPVALTVCSHSANSATAPFPWSARCLPSLIVAAGWLLLSGLSYTGWSTPVCPALGLCRCWGLMWHRDWSCVSSGWLGPGLRAPAPHFTVSARVHYRDWLPQQWQTPPYWDTAGCFRCSNHPAAVYTGMLVLEIRC